MAYAGQLADWGEGGREGGTRGWLADNAVHRLIGIDGDEGGDNNNNNNGNNNGNASSRVIINGREVIN